MRPENKNAFWTTNGGIIGPEECTSENCACVVGVPNHQTLEDIMLARKLCEWHNCFDAEPVLNDILCGHCGRVFYIERHWEDDITCPYCGMVVFSTTRH
jgi:DNA-directed RNA polymerase subunit RPC12/RpoP